jgi:hypothetical protein
MHDAPELVFMTGETMFESGFSERSAAAVLGLALAVSWPARAAAQAAPEPAAPAAESAPAPGSIQLTSKPKMDLATPAPAPPEGRTYRYHEGFYTRVGVGFGGLFNNKSNGSISSSTGGLALTYELLIGGSPAPGFTIGGGALGEVQLSGNWDVDESEPLGNVGVDASGNLTTLVVGPFVDGFPNASGPFHLGGALGLGVGTVKLQGESRTPLGIGGAFWAGWDVWVAPEWSMGARLRLDGMYGKDGDFSANTVAASMMLSVLYN